jgi:Chaperone of endosialidase
VGAHAVVGQSNSLVLGGTDQYAVMVGIGTKTPSNVLTIGRGAGHPVSDSWETYSSRRWKKNIHPLQNALSKVEQLRGVSYDLKDSDKHEIGVIAEEVGQVVPEVVSYEQNSKDATGVDYSRLTALLIEATKEQQREIRDLKSELRATRQTLQKVQAQVAATQPALVAVK